MIARTLITSAVMQPTVRQQVNERLERATGTRSSYWAALDDRMSRLRQQNLTITPRTAKVNKKLGWVGMLQPTSTGDARELPGTGGSPGGARPAIMPEPVRVACALDLALSGEEGKP